MTDIQEYRYGLDPEIWSSATNGIPDGWAIKYGFDPTLATTASLINSNGYTTFQNYTADLNPTNPASRLAITSLSVDGGDVHLTWTGGNEAWQTLEWTPTLASDQWLPLFTNIPPMAVTNSITLPGGDSTNRFYRINAHR